MNKLYLTLLFAVTFTFISFSGYAQKRYIYLSILQPSVEECITNIENTFEQGDIKVFPNPSEGLFTIEISNLIHKNRISLIVYDISGKELICQQFIAGDRIQKTINLSGYNKGSYILIIKGEQNAVYKAKLIIY